MPDGNGSEIGDQKTILSQQLNHFISRDCPHVAVLSAFPLLFTHYLSSEVTTRLAAL